MSTFIKPEQDALAVELGQARATVINMAIYRAVEHGLMIDALRKKTDMFIFLSVPP